MMIRFLLFTFLITSLVAELPLPLDVKVEKGYLTLENKEGKEEGKLFYVAYFQEPRKGEAERPLTFCFNGGPGAATVFFHLGGIGPIKISEGPGQLEKNPSSLLRFSDLVFIDAMATGFSRTAAGVDLAPYLSFEGDMESLSQGITVFLNRYKKWSSPLYLAGASYGTIRIIGIAAHLFEHYHIGIDGLLLISGLLDFENVSVDASNDFPYLFSFPTYAILAKKNGAEAEAFLEKKYQPALFLGDALPESAVQTLAQELSEWTTLPKEEILKMRLRISPYAFRELFTKGEVLGRFDASVTQPSPGDVGYNLHLDPSFIPLLALFHQKMNYFLKELGGEQEKESYVVLSDSAQKWKFLLRDHSLNVAPMLRRLLYNNPKLKVFAASGLYDLATPYYGMKYGIRHLLLDEATQKRVKLNLYEGGHMFYGKPSSVEALVKDVKSFFDK
jgi:carboxypeptidase C (cathepsin A)